MSATLFDNAPWASAQPRLSVLIPFKGDDPRALIATLAREPAAVEIVLLDDGTGDSALSGALQALIADLPLPIRLVTLAVNEGRAKGRNRLVSHARAGHFLFLDSDMAPDSPDFLKTWLALIERTDPAVAFGGFSLDQVEPRRDQALHWAMAAHSDCLSAAERSLSPEKHVFTSNLLVRRDVFAAEGFDEGFAGWGWEDVEWGMRVARRWPIVHIDNTATHLGLDPASVIAAKYEQSAANFARVVAAHPDVVSAYPSYRAAKILRRVPLRGLWRPLIKAFALNALAPLPSRAFAMRLYRAALYAEAV
ncbi:glycosyltransferase [Phenylobacterium sp.]|jgi:glycosyltransferase involved in cell wall biosynthesis|uniref:polysaccharide biosynthesis protein HfsG n=1 Tax=Phenylobacterium sp. TaxID=1871053 RepID=UPI000C97ABFE|nr:glycosyltransferase [Phenylobacterium sp.]MAK81118.1 glycosyl transferase [Phenylobacterium sp.]|tara:strand:- start:3243 stop:4163 length:921 start_codon:yes stop_codon:yes gene_type:complete